MRAFKAQGELSWEKQTILDNLKEILHISESRHRAETLRCNSDPLLENLSKQSKEGLLKFVKQTKFTICNQNQN